MSGKDWKDQINGSVGQIIDAFLTISGVFMFFLLWNASLPLWFSILAGLFIAFGLPLLLHLQAPGLYKTAGEKDAEFEQARRFGKKR